MPLKKQVAIVTGGNTGIGQANVPALARYGANIVIDYVAHPEATEALSKGGMGMPTRTAGVERAPRDILVVGTGPGR
ncbi:hypothetical protein [Methyloceanibacter sp.]|uniref:hypothetical protein n=1 Tax=Methyloceanibacter sp. TaxID=1965321 RepID=UPI002C3454B2|nr:hypothetical protein [Methyloceanibacter sp.]HML92904.1 hypothetical protein [Methyloceanibacter sp.]